MPKLTVEGYMVKYPVGRSNMMLASGLGISISRREAIQKFKPRLLPGKTWKQAYRQGARVVWVRIREIGEA